MMADWEGKGERRKGREGKWVEEGREKEKKGKKGKERADI
jgi:hypothetical protein